MTNGSQSLILYRSNDGMLFDKSWIVHLDMIPCSRVRYTCMFSVNICVFVGIIQSVSGTQMVTVEGVRAPSYYTHTHTHTVCYGQDKILTPTPINLHLGCSYHLHSSHHFFPAWGAVMLEKKKKKLI